MAKRTRGVCVRVKTRYSEKFKINMNFMNFMNFITGLHKLLVNQYLHCGPKIYIV